MSAQPTPKAKLPTYGQLQAQIVLLRAELAVVRQEPAPAARLSAPYVASYDALAAEQKRSAAYLEALRRIVRKADAALDLRMHEQLELDMRTIRLLALNAIADNKE